MTRGSYLLVETDWYRLIMTASICLLVAQLSAVLAAPASDQDSKFKIDDFAMYVQGTMNADILTDVSSSETSQIVEHPRWAGRPVSVGAPTRNGFLRVRLESDFLVIWLRRTKAASAQHNDLGDVVKQATATLLRQSFVIDESAVKSGPRLIGRPQKVAGTDIAVCSYSSPTGSNRWSYVDTTYVLVKGADVIVVMEKAKARTADQGYLYEGLAANKRHEASSVIPGIEDMSGIPTPLQDGCMWPSDEHGGTDIGSVRRLALRNEK